MSVRAAQEWNYVVVEVGLLTVILAKFVVAK